MAEQICLTGPDRDLEALEREAFEELRYAPGSEHYTWEEFKRVQKLLRAAIEAEELGLVSDD